MKPFDITDTPLQGAHIIEASAGTGKTHAIAGLFLRLILEQELLIKEILVVTFTEAATEELRERIRKRLKEALDAVTGSFQPPAGDELLKRIVIRFRGNPRSRDVLSTALTDFDEAAIYTIHGFCQRMLRENAFESNALFDTELVADQSTLLQVLVDDFWRKHFYTAAPLFVQYAISKKYSPETFLTLIRRKSIAPELAIVPVIAEPDIDGVQHELQKAFDRLAAAWRSDRAAVQDILLNSSALSKAKYKTESVAALVRTMNTYLDAGALFPLFKEFEKLTGTAIAKAVKKGCPLPAHPFFDLCEEFAENYKNATAAFDMLLLYLKQELFHYMNHAMKKRKLELNVRSFDDLLEDMHCALASGDFLARAIRRKFSAALIDEFQDTDPVQYDIFSMLFNTDKHILFLIGDPKQAIYRFRGADIFAYLKAAAEMDDGHQFTLTTNWRSEPGLISAVNTIFSETHNQFVFDRIQYHAISPAPLKDQDKLTICGTGEPPLRIWFIDRTYADKDDGTINKGSAEALVAKTVASEIVRLATLAQQGEITIGRRALSPGDIAVLVRKNRQARLVQEELMKRSMPSVLYGAESIFDSPEAIEVERVISAIAEPGSERKLKAALATDIFGWTGNDVAALNSQQEQWEDVLGWFHQYHDQWRQWGFIRMFRQLIKSADVRKRLLSFRDGERRMTNLLQCAEVLHRAELEQKLGMEGLIKWFAAQRNSEDASDEDQIRLETDENAVKLITIHRSKGLEYPVVFCPFAWDSSTIKNEPVLFHDAQHNNRLTFDIGSGDEKNIVQASTEELAENMRLLYVALTRAKHCCYLVWGKINEAETAAPAYLFHQPEQPHSKNIVSELEERVKKLRYEEMLAEVQRLQTVNHNILVSHLPAIESRPFSPQADATEDLACRNFSATIEQDWMIASYSSLISARSSYADQPDYDRVSKLSGVQTVTSMPPDIFSFPRGADAGSCIHKIFENLDFHFTNPEQEQALILKYLREYGIDEQWQQVLWEMVQRVIATQLSHSAPEFALADIQAGQRLHELEFYFPLTLITAEGLSAFFANMGDRDISARLRQLGFSPVRGYMRGFIDMVFCCHNRFYLIDWKSNYLGDSIESYSQAALQNAMEEHHYTLQYHLYTIALHRYLSLRKTDYEYTKHFGGVYYIFVRGVDPQHGLAYGIYYDRPAYNLIASISNYLSGRNQ